MEGIRIQEWLNWGGITREGGREERKETQMCKEKKLRTKANSHVLFIGEFPTLHSPLTQNRPMIELTAAWRMVGRVSQEWGARRPRREPILKFSSACRIKETPQGDGVAWRYPRIFPTLDIRSLQWNGIFNLPCKGSGKANKQPNK